MLLKEKQSFAGNLEMLRKKLDTNWIHELRFLAGVFQEFLGHVYIFCGQGVCKKTYPLNRVKIESFKEHSL